MFFLSSLFLRLKVNQTRKNCVENSERGMKKMCYKVEKGCFFWHTTQTNSRSVLTETLFSLKLLMCTRVLKHRAASADLWLSHIAAQPPLPDSIIIFTPQNVKQFTNCFHSS